MRRLLLAVSLLISWVSLAQTYTFTNAGANGATGPNQAQIDAAYTGTDLQGNVISAGGIQEWTVPVTGTYTIEAWGAEGGKSNNGTNNGGKGTQMKGDFILTAGDKLKILVGQQGGQNNGMENYGGGGGGGSYVTYSNNTPLIVAGGGGGAAITGNGNIDAVTGTSGQTGVGSDGGSGGTNGNGGVGGEYGDGGAGLIGDGASGIHDNLSGAPESFTNGGVGQDVDNTNCCGGVGGFGGGSAGQGGAGGGGGYSGGGGGGGPPGGPPVLLIRISAPAACNSSTGSRL